MPEIAPAGELQVYKFRGNQTDLKEKERNSRLIQAEFDQKSTLSLKNTVICFQCVTKYCAVSYCPELKMGTLNL